MLFSVFSFQTRAEPSGKKGVKNLDRPVAFGVEKGSRFRSQERRPELAAPVVYGDLILAASSRKKLAAFDFQGQTRLEVPLDYAPLSTPAVGNGKLYLGGDDGKFHCLELASGKELWSFPLKTIDLSPPTLTDTLVIFQTANDRVLALSAETGKWAWELQYLRSDDLALRGLAPVLVKDGVAYVGLSGGMVAALSADSGKVIWKNRLFRGEQFMDVDAPLVADETNVYAVSAGGFVAALSRKTGKVFWTYEAGGLAGGALDGNTLYLATDQAEVMGINKITGKPAWKTQTAEPEKLRFYDLPLRPAILPEFLVTVTRSGRVLGIDKNSGQIIREFDYHTNTSNPVVVLPGQKGFLTMDDKGMIRIWGGK